MNINPHNFRDGNSTLKAPYPYEIHHRTDPNSFFSCGNSTNMVPLTSELQTVYSNSSPKKTSQLSESESFNVLLSEIVVIYKHDWKKIAHRINTLKNTNFSPKYLRSEYKALKSGLNSSRFYKTFHKAEDKDLLKIVKEKGRNWRLISNLFQDRDPLSLKNRYYYMIRKSKGDLIERTSKSVCLKMSDEIKLPKKGEMTEVSLDTLVEKLAFDQIPAWYTNFLPYDQEIFKTN